MCEKDLTPAMIEAARALAKAAGFAWDCVGSDPTGHGKAFIDSVRLVAPILATGSRAVAMPAPGSADDYRAAMDDAEEMGYLRLSTLTMQHRLFLKTAAALCEIGSRRDQRPEEHSFSWALRVLGSTPHNVPR